MSEGVSTDIVVVGAGTAGLAAAKTAMALGLSVTTVEAKDRIGGRAFTDAASLGVPWDRGAHWLHHASRNFFARFAQSLGIELAKRPATAHLWAGDRWADRALARRRAHYFERAFEVIRETGEAGRDLRAADVVPPDREFRAMFNSWYAAVAGVEPDRTSTLDDARYHVRDENWRARGGYGALVARYGADVPVALGTPAERVRWGGGEVVVDTPRGALRAHAAIVTLSTGALASGAIRFDPPLPAALREAFEAIPLGEAEKVAFAFDRDVFGLEPFSTVHYVHEGSAAIRFQVRPFGDNVAIGHLSGRFAAALERAGEAAMTDFAEEQLVRVFGAGIRRAVTATATTHWTSDPYIRGGYSCALPGKADWRARLSEPVRDRLFFAGEACSIHAYGTVHGAYETGVAAARRAADAVRRIGPVSLR